MIQSEAEFIEQKKVELYAIMHEIQSFADQLPESKAKHYRNLAGNLLKSVAIFDLADNYTGEIPGEKQNPHQ